MRFEPDRQRARRAGRSKDPQELEFLAAGLAHHEWDAGPDLGKVCAWAIAQFESALSVPLLEHASREGSEVVRSNVAYALSKMHPTADSEALLLRLADDPADSVVLWAALALSHSADHVPFLLDHLRQHPELPRAGYFADALNRIDATSAALGLKRVLGEMPPERSSQIRELLESLPTKGTGA